MTEQAGSPPEKLPFVDRRGLFWQGLKKQNLADDLDSGLLGLIEEGEEFAWVLPTKTRDGNGKYIINNIEVRLTTAREASAYYVHKLEKQSLNTALEPRSDTPFGSDPDLYLITIYSDFHDKTLFAYRILSGERIWPQDDVHEMAAQAGKRIIDSETALHAEFEELD